MEKLKINNERQHKNDNDKNFSKIHTLPDEVLIHIFQYMDKNTLLTASECCLRWRNLIENDIKTMKQFEKSIILIFRKNANEKVDFKMDFPNGNYQNLFISTYCSSKVGVKTISDEGLSEILPYKNSTKKLRLYEMDKLTADKILNHFDMLEQLVIINYSLDYSCSHYSNTNPKKVNDINLPQLKTLETHASYRFLMNYKTLNLKSLKIYEWKTWGDFNLSLNSYIISCKNLSHLEIAGSLEVLEFDIEGISFKLENLIVENLNLIDENFADFLMSQSSTLKSLTFIHNEKCSRSLSVIFEQLKLEYLEINVNYIENEVFSNNSIKKLVTYNYQFDLGRNPQTFNLLRYRHENLSQGINPLSLSEKYAKVFSACKNIEEFSLFGCKNPETLYRIFETLSVSNKDLKALYLTTIPQLPNPNIKFTNLEILEIDKIETFKHFQALSYILNYFPNVKVLKINNCIDQHLNFTPQFVIKIISTLIHLEEIFLGFEVDSKTNEISLIVNCFKEIVDSGRNLRILKFLNGQITRVDREKFTEFKESAIWTISELKSELNNFSGVLERKFYKFHMEYNKLLGSNYFFDSAGYPL